MPPPPTGEETMIIVIINLNRIQRKNMPKVTGAGLGD